MSGDVQPRKRKDKKRKKDDEDAVKETPSARQPSAGAAQAATQPGDIQMHIHSEHGTGGNWCAKIVFFLLLTCLGVLTGLIMIENRGVSNADTPLSESRYAEYFSGWVDENREDDHHHEDILNALNQLEEEHGDDDGHDEEPYTEEEDHDDDEQGGHDEEDEADEEELRKLDDDEVEEIVAAEKKVAQQEAALARDDDDADAPAAVPQTTTGKVDDGDDDDVDDGKEDDDDDGAVVKDESNDEADAIAKEIENIADANDADDDGDNDEDDDDEDDNSPFDEEANKLNLASTENEVPKGAEATGSSNKDSTVVVDQLEKPDISVEILKSQMDDLVENYNKLAEMLNVPKEDYFQDTISIKDENDDDQIDQQVDDDGDDDNDLGGKVEERTSFAPNDDDGDDDVDGDDDGDGDAFENFVDNDGGEEEYLAKVRQEQELKNQRLQQQEKEEPREESSQIPSRPSESDSYQGELERAKRQLDEFKDTKAALQSFETLLGRYPDLKPALVGKARTLDLMAEQQQSNTILEDAIEAYRKVLALGRSLDDGTLQTIAERCINRIRFSGQYLKAVDVHQVLIKRFDSEPKFRNQLAVTYLMANRLAEAKAVLHETLLRWIEDGFALVHYGFVVKNHDKNMEEAVQYLQEGIATGHEGTQDGRFYFHLGDALQRLGRNEEALKVYQKGADKKLFLSMYQRSLYNEDNLKSHPFWTVEQTTYGGQLELIRSQWTTIRDEGLRLLNSAGNFKDEAENLRDTGDWKQFELFMRGHRIEKNCAKAPLTCKLVEQFTAARTCKRGQVKFSVMHPGTHVWPHCGPTNCRIRAHLGLKVPSDTYIRVAEETRSWQDGQWLIFDDSYEHEVWHNGTGTRLVLIVDFWHPDLSESQRRTLSPI
ncbi:aspartyl/asparaginyl beta-hydroxylase [Sabethes cyaneus]|uniref:aspartyl/asparaginyl beta-hydroxylase n=1 Tax=Sabethes cyaneus TaxID=53552 RepID=UPI00221E2949|nr:aspartyl/asparaginyl beta-hydroxylase [Sabethes cyaneus]